MASRADPVDPRDPWDAGCTVDPIIGGKDAMDAYRTTLDAVIKAAEASTTQPFVNGAWQRGHVYIVDWRFNCLRDISTNTDPWMYQTPPDEDPTAIGMVRRLMQAGVQVRLLLWYPNWAATFKATAGLEAHVEDHRYAATLVEAENRRLMDEVFQVPSGSDPLGVVALDMRTAEGSSFGSLHQKMMLVRSPTVNVAFAGGVDLAYTRRDAPLTDGDWQSADRIPKPGPTWPRPADDGKHRYDTVDSATPQPTTPPGTDLPVTDKAGIILFGPRQSWHDQHLMLHGPIVATLEHQFAERWRDTARYYSMQDSDTHIRNQQVIFSTAEAIVDGNPNTTRPLPPIDAVQPTGSSTVQMWRTIPWRDSRTGPPFTRAEFTVLAGIANAVNNAGQLIWIFDQYFWSRSLATQLHRQLRANPDLRVIIVLPAHADDPSNATKQHQARFDALSLVMNASGQSVAGQVGVYSLWDPQAPPAPAAPDGWPANPPQPDGRGVYVHAKVQMYDGALLVCGSANLNRRSLYCDAELALAVADPAVVALHQRRLWNYLFPAGTVPWPAPDFTKAGSGPAFFDAFNEAVGVTAAGTTGPSRLIRDPWDADGKVLPAGAFRERSGPGWYYKLVYYPVIMDPSSLDNACEKHWPDAENNSDWRTLDTVSYALENTFTPAKGDKPATYPYRKQA
jgi:phosphatidylserine/phosphatidylglycerophosphate/cardiolipin synthase-like enzyme